ncbi:MAG: Anucleate primary sterigmata protein B [Trizodia sp. TS-e1964]|nr:MAG: Anucleate primary sterigmata protein B [Trizodia sp. TS-e1964]
MSINNLPFKDPQSPAAASQAPVHSPNHTPYATPHVSPSSVKRQLAQPGAPDDSNTFRIFSRRETSFGIPTTTAPAQAQGDTPQPVSPQAHHLSAKEFHAQYRDRRASLRSSDATGSPGLFAPEESSMSGTPATNESQGQHQALGGIDVDEELSFVAVKAGGQDDITSPVFEDLEELPPLPQEDGSLFGSEDAGDTTIASIDKINEPEMRRKLMDIESSFLPEHSAIAFGMPEDGAENDHSAFAHEARGDSRGILTKSIHHEETIPEETSYIPSSPPTPSEAYKTPAPQRYESPTPENGSTVEGEALPHIDTSMLETMSSSPTVEAAKRTMSRAINVAQNPSSAKDPQSPVSNSEQDEDEKGDITPRKGLESPDGQQKLEVPSLDLKSPVETDTNEKDEGQATGSLASRLSRRPKSWLSQNVSQRSSVSSFMTNTTIDGVSDVTLGADYALQSGGAVPTTDHTLRANRELSRSGSLGSIASGISTIGEGTWERGRNVSGTSMMSTGGMSAADRHLARLDEEDRLSQDRELAGDSQLNNAFSDPKTPKAKDYRVVLPTDTVIARSVQDMQVPESVAREYREKMHGAIPGRGSTMPTPLPGRSTNKNLTLKEQSSTIDRLTTENWDLKLKYFLLQQASRKHSEEGVQELIAENANLQATVLNLQNASKGLTKTVKDLKKQLKEKDEAAAASNVTGEKGIEDNKDDARREVDQKAKQEYEEEITYLKERVETYSVEIERLRRDSVIKEGEKRRLAELVRSMGERRGGDPDLGAREESDMWKDLLDAETARREQADADNRKLRDELWRLQNDGSSTTTNNHTSNVYHMSKRQTAFSARPGSSNSEFTADRNGRFSATSSTLVEQLRHENEELRREVGAQTSMLTSRNREKERLYQEIEDLKLGIRQGDGLRSVAGDSIFERSASRAMSRVSGITRHTQLSENEREDFENKNAVLRDRISELKLKNQEFERKLEELLDELEVAEAAKSQQDELAATYEGEMDQMVQDMQAMQSERDEALKQYEELEADYQALKNEAQTEVNTLEAELEERGEDVHRLQSDLANREENFNALQSEMRAMSEALVRLEDDHQNNLRKILTLQGQLEDANKEYGELENSLSDANGKIERLAVQLESSQGEIAFLREDQDGDKIKIGDLETAIKTVQRTLRDERERVKELEQRVVDERHQREIVGSKEKQEVQRVMNDLNREASTAKDEARRLRKSLTSREIEATEWKERLMELENNLREALGDLNGTRSSLLNSITKLQKELDTTVSELETTRQELSDKDRVLKSRDALLESHGLESRKLADLLDKERHARKIDKDYYEKSTKVFQKSHQAISQHQNQVLELQAGRREDRKKLNVLENQFREQLTERNALLLTLWNRLSAVCGTDWQHKNSIVNGRSLPTLEVVATQLPGFSKNLLSAVKTIESLVQGFRTKVRSVERDLWKEYQTLEHNLDIRTKKLDRLEATVLSGKTLSDTSTSAIAKLRGENRLLKAELTVMQKQDHMAKSAATAATRTSSSSTTALPDKHSSSSAAATNIPLPIPNPHQIHLPAPSPLRALSRTIPTQPTSLTRQHTAPPSIDALEKAGGPGSVAGVLHRSLDLSEQKWIQRLRELERRLKAEREARLLDRSGARKRLEERSAENEELRLALEREKVRRGE